MRKISIDENAIKILFKKNKQVLLPIVAIIFGIILIILVIVPQIRNLAEVRKELETESEKLTILKNNLAILNNLSDSDLNSKVELTTSALPAQKDFAGILNAIMLSSIKNNVALGNFDFSVGDVTKLNEGASKTFPTIQVKVTVTGSQNNVSGFLSDMYKSMPVSEISKLKINPSFSSATIIFYFKSLAPVNIQSEASMRPISNEGSTILKELESWSNSKQQIFNIPAPQEPATESAR